MLHIQDYVFKYLSTSIFESFKYIFKCKYYAQQYIFVHKAHISTIMVSLKRMYSRFM